MRRCDMVQHMDDDAPLLTSAQVAQLLGVSIRTVHRAADYGQLPVAQRLPGPNGALLYRTEDVEAYKARKSVAA